MEQSKTRTITLLVLVFSFGALIFSNLQATQFRTTPNPNPHSENVIVVKNSKVIFDLFGEQLTPSKVLKTGFIKTPKHGKVKFNTDESVVYIPYRDVCEETDLFSYFIKTPEGIDTIEIQVEILCESLTILNGFSPDGDGQNDTFTILGVQNYPDNSLLIFNKWGEQVYAEKGYKNDWSGSRAMGENLASEDSVYYYVFEDGKGKSYSGYLQILAKN